MLITLLKITVLTSMLAIFYQDRKDREVYWWLFALSAMGLGALHIFEVGWFQFCIHSMINCVLIGSILLILWGYARFKLRSASLTAVFGLGDSLFLFALALGFSTVSFITLFVFGLLFSLVLHLVMQRFFSRKREKEDVENTVPLAGYLALFFAGVLTTHWLGGYEDLYVI